MRKAERTTSRRVWEGLTDEQLPLDCGLAPTCGPLSLLAPGDSLRPPAATRVPRLQQRNEIIGVLFFDGEDVLHQPPRGHVLVAEPPDDLVVGGDGDALCDEVFSDHGDEVGAFYVLGVAARAEPVGVEVGRTLELHDACRDAVGMSSLVGRVLEELAAFDALMP